MEQYSSAADYVQHFNAAELWDGFIKYPGASMDFEKISSKEKEMIETAFKSSTGTIQMEKRRFLPGIES
jgi:hypothetical protein